MILLTEYSQEEEGNLTDFKKSIKICFRKKQIKGWVILYVLFNAVYRCNTLISTLFLETPLENQGFGIDSQLLSSLFFICFFPSLFFIFYSPFIVGDNKVFEDRAFLKLVVGIYIFSTLMIPLLRDIFPNVDSPNRNLFLFLN